MQPGGRIRPHRPVADLNNATINECMRGRGLERPGDGVAALFLEGDFGRSVSGRYFFLHTHGIPINGSKTITYLQGIIAIIVALGSMIKILLSYLA